MVNWTPRLLPAYRIFSLNPHPRERATAVMREVLSDCIVSIHARVNGRQMPSLSDSANAVFQSTPA